MTPAPALTHFERDLGVPFDRTLINALLETSADRIYFKDRDSRFTAVSRSLARYHRFDDPAELIGKTDADFFAAEYAAAARDDELSIMAAGEPMLGKSERIVWPDGRKASVVTTKLPLRSEDGEIVGIFGITKDAVGMSELELALERANKDLLVAARMAGSAEMAGTVLHNVGNVINSVNVSASVVANGVRDLKLDRLGQISALLEQHTQDLGSFLTTNPTGRRVPEFIAALAKHSDEVRTRVLGELDSLRKNIDHVKEIVSMQQAYATTAGVTEPLDAITIMDDAARMNSGALVRHEVKLTREYQTVPRIFADKSKVLQILINLIRNAKYACDESGRPDRLITLRIEPGAPGRVRLIVQDNGVGISEANRARLFVRGFTTRTDGHGIGLHASALAAKDIDGKLTAESEGSGKGATFTLDVPVVPPIPGIPQ